MTKEEGEITKEEKGWHQFFMVGVELGFKHHEKGMNLEGALLAAQNIWDAAYGGIV